MGKLLDPTTITFFMIFLVNMNIFIKMSKTVFKVKIVNHKNCHISYSHFITCQSI